MEKFYFSFGSDDLFPYHDGYIVVEAPSFDDACRWFLDTFPGRDAEVLNCSFVYEQGAWERISHPFTQEKPLTIFHLQMENGKIVSGERSV